MQGVAWTVRERPGRALLGLLVAAACALAANATPALATLPTGNLLQNGDAEAGTCSSDGHTAESIPNWTTAGGLTVGCYSGLTGLPDSTVSTAIGGGNNLFYGNVNPSATATQTVDVSSAATEIDAGNIVADLSGDLGGYSTKEDNMVVIAVFLSGSDQPLGTPIHIGPVTAADRGNVTTLISRSTSGSVPAGTRKIQVTMTATRSTGTDNDASADNLSLTLPPPPPLTNTSSPTLLAPGESVSPGSPYGLLGVGREARIDPGQWTGDPTSFTYTVTGGFQDSNFVWHDAYNLGTLPSETFLVPSSWYDIGGWTSGLGYSTGVFVNVVAHGPSGDSAPAQTNRAMAEIPRSPHIASRSVNVTSPYGASVAASIYSSYDPTDYWVEYGSTTGYGSSTPHQSLPGLNARNNVTIPINGLQPGHAYHFVLIARNIVGDDTHVDIAFATPAAQLNPNLFVKGSTATQQVKCLTAASCTGKLTLQGLGGLAARASVGTATLGKGRFRIRGHHRKVVSIHLRRPAVAALRRHRKLVATEELSQHVAGQAAVTDQQVTLKR